MRRLFRQFSFPGGIPSHVAPETPGSIHEGGELGYVLSHAYGAAMDNPDLVVAAVVGDGEFETGPLARVLARQQVRRPGHDGAVLPILHLNGYKIANPTIPARIPREELESLLRGYGHEVLTVEGDDPPTCTGSWPPPWTRRTTRSARSSARPGRTATLDRRPWPMILLVTPKGWTGPKVDGMPGRGHLARPPGAAGRHPRERRPPRGMLEDWMRSYRPDELFDDDGRPSKRVRAARAGRAPGG